MVVNQAQVEDVLFGADGAAAALPAGATVMLSSTVPAAYVQALGERLAAQGLHLLDAPVSGGAVAAGQGELTIMASGTAEAFAAAETALAACAKQVHRLGAAPGIGSTVKAVNQLLAGIHVVSAAEGMAFGVALGADPKVLYEVIRGAAGGSWMFDNRVPHMLDDDYTPRSAVDIWVKDLGLVLDSAQGAQAAAAGRRGRLPGGDDGRRPGPRPDRRRGLRQGLRGLHRQADRRQPRHEGDRAHEHPASVPVRPVSVSLRGRPGRRLRL